jgi:PKHD-type hydroxylase
MLLRIPQLLNPEQLVRCKKLMATDDWIDGRITAGTQSANVKRNQQLPEDSPAARDAQQIILQALSDNGMFLSAALPKRVFPPLFNRYANGMDFGNHIDNAIRTHVASGQHIRTDMSMTVFLADPHEYEGGELVIEDTFGSQSIKLAAGDAILYPSSSVHRVTPITRGARVASFFWIESRVREAERRRLLFEMDQAIVQIRAKEGESETAVKLTGCYHNLLRMWAEG